MLNGALATDGQCEALFKVALEACERYYQAFQFVVWAGKESSEALASSMFETEGRAWSTPRFDFSVLSSGVRRIGIGRRIPSRPRMEGVAAGEVCQCQFNLTARCCSRAQVTWASPCSAVGSSGGS